MPFDQPAGDMSWPQAAVVISVVLAFVAIAAIDSGVALIIGIFALLFGYNIIAALLGLESPASDTPEEAEADEPTVDDKQDALDRLRTRYAEGELTEAEFERRLETLLETETVGDVERYLEKTDSEEQTSERTETIFESSER